MVHCEMELYIKTVQYHEQTYVHTFLYIYRHLTSNFNRPQRRSGEVIG